MMKEYMDWVGAFLMVGVLFGVALSAISVILGLTFVLCKYIFMTLGGLV